MMCTWRGGGNIDSETDHKTSDLVLGRHYYIEMQCIIISENNLAICNIH